ncbi:MAG: RluA family pseudouridine synthase [Deltaproteobacteria bacterium]|nr:RluA family pseudouridine synthase [Deltaproteobacteria bacterium]
MAVTLPSAACRDRSARFAARTAALPGAVPQDNRRPMHVPLRHDGVSLHAFLAAAHPHLSQEMWQQRAGEGLLWLNNKVVTDLGVTVRAGNTVVHVIRNDVEPWVNTGVAFLYEDDALAVVSKPAPLAVHPCGRYNRNSLLPLLVHAFGETFWRPVHRLDVDTTGLMVLAKTATAARHLGQQFERRDVRKLYLARVHGVPAVPRFTCELPLGDRPGQAGKRHTESEALGLPAHTQFEWIHTDGSQSVVTANPHSGRTNQIRVHLAALGLPIVGDHAYSGDEEFTTGQQPLCLHAWTLAFAHPDDGRAMAFEDEAPAWAREPQAQR